MHIRPATMVTAVVVAFALGGVARLSTQTTGVAPRDADVAGRDSETTLNSALDQNEVLPLDSTPEIEAAQSVSTPTVDPAVVEEFLRSIDAIEALAQGGRRECDALGEPFYDLEQPGPRGDAHIERWNDFAREWENDVSRAATRMPSPPAWNADPELTYAYQDITGAIGELRHATMGSGSRPVPFRADWTARFNEATRRLEQARARLKTR